MASLRRCPDIFRPPPQPRTSRLHIGCRLRLQKNLSGPRRSQADLCGPKRTGRAEVAGRQPPRGVADSQFRTPHFAFRISPGPATRQYPAIPGNTRTKVHFLAAYCRLTVRLLPRIQFPCRVLPAHLLVPLLVPLLVLLLVLVLVIVLDLSTLDFGPGSSPVPDTSRLEFVGDEVTSL